MVELDIQLLVGAATTVFLALIFFGVVVLWDVALALRSVGDKIDKLEDNIDDDLMDIAHALDGISNGPGNGGTQLHLNGGTISSGPQEQGQPTQGHPQGPQQAPQQAADETARQASQQRQGGQQPSQAGEPGAVDDENEPAAPEPTEGGDGVDDLEQPTDATGTGDDVTTAESTSDEGVSESATEATEPAHPRADSNRGRFITSPDRTAWYTTSLDSEAIRTAQPTIAGALTDGSEAAVDESEIIAAGPAESAAASESAEADDVSEATGAVDRDETADSDPGDGSAAGEGDDVDSVTWETDESDEIDDSVPTDTDVLGFDEDETDADEDSSPPESNDASATDDAADREAESSDQSTTETGMEPVDETGVDVHETESDGRSDSLQRADGDSETLEITDSDDGSELEGEDDASSETVADESAEPVSGNVGTFEFDDDIEADVTVEAAVETINENAPAPELSSHRFDVTAEVYESEDDDRDGAVLLFEFDTETVDISGSTKRLLQYQMRSFADRDSTPDGDVRIGRDRIVIEIPDSDGTDIQRWGEAAVSIIDRTLYLSDNSSDGN